MLKKLELYFFRRDFCSVSEKVIREIYLISGVRSPPQNKSCNSDKDIAEYLVSLIKEGNDTVVLYESLDNKLEGKPRLTLTTGMITTEALSSPSILRNIHKCLVELLSQK